MVQGIKSVPSVCVSVCNYVLSWLTSLAHGPKFDGGIDLEGMIISQMSSIPDEFERQGHFELYKES